MISGDNELAALDFSKHYRAPLVHLLDADCAVQLRYHGQVSWPFMLLADSTGKIVWSHHGTLADAKSAARAQIERVLANVASPAMPNRNGLTYARATLERSGELERTKRQERFPSVACGPDGKKYVVFTRSTDRSEDVLLRVYEADRAPVEFPIAATDADEYDGTVLVDGRGRIWTTWTSDADGRNYNVYVVSFTAPHAIPEPLQLTRHEDDAMHPRMACDKSGGVWITYYKWHHLGAAGSRDKEVYARRLDGATWSDEIHVSPAEVPRYEDHTEPAIAPYADGVIIAWNWDFHPPRGYTGTAKTPTAFVRTIDNQLRLGPYYNVSGGSIDLTPAIAIDSRGVPWCAWDSLNVHRAPRRTVCLRSWTPRVAGEEADGRPDAPPTVVCTGETCVLLPAGASLPNPNNGSVARRVCTPTFAVSPEETVTLVWAESDSTGRWVLKRTDLPSRSRTWSPPSVFLADGNPRFLSAAYDDRGMLWGAAAVETPKGREVVLRSFRGAS